MDLFNLKITQIKLVANRNYLISSDQLELLDPKGEKKFANWMNNRKKIYINQKIEDEFVMLKDAYVNNIGNIMYIMYARKNKEFTVGIDVVKQFVNDINTENTNIGNKNMKEGRLKDYGKIVESILIVDGDLTSDSRKFLFEAPNPRLRIQVYHYKDLMFSPLEHKDSPKYMLLTETEKIEKYKEMKVDSSKINVIYTTDAISKFSGWKEGDLIRIYREDISVNLLNPISVNYRIVLEPNSSDKENSKKK